MYKEASKIKLRVQTTHGLLSIEQLWSLSFEELDSLAVQLEETYKKSKKAKSFLYKRSAEDKVARLRFEIVHDILTTKMDEQSEAANAQVNKEEAQKLMSLIAKKKESALEELSVEELEKRLAKIK